MVMLSIAIAFLLCKYFNTYTMNLKKLFFAFGIVFLGAVPADVPVSGQTIIFAGKSGGLGFEADPRRKSETYDG